MRSCSRSTASSVASRPFSGGPNLWSAGSMCSRRLRYLPFLYWPALAVLSPQIVVGREHVGDTHVGAVVVDLLSGTQRHNAEEHDLGETGGVLERTGGFQLSFGGVNPIHLVCFAVDARELLVWLAKCIVERAG